MKFRELTEEQMDKICDYIEKRDWIRDEHGILANGKRACKNCPFTIYVGEYDYYDCNRPDLDRELPQEFVDIIKKD